MTNADIRRDQLLVGKCLLNRKLLNKTGAKSSDKETAERMFQSMWNNYLSSKSSTSIPYWADQFKSKRVFAILTQLLSNTEWAIVNMDAKRNWGEIQLNEAKLLTYLTEEELAQVRMDYKMAKYQPAHNEVKSNNTTKQGNSKRNTGLVRRGFAKAGESEYQYDIPTIEYNRAVIELQLTKSMDKLGLKYEAFKDSLNYSDIAKEVLQYVIDNPLNVYTTGQSNIDSRGRAISEVLRQVFNPISNKEARSCLKLFNPLPMVTTAEKDVYLFIAELIGAKSPSLIAKIRAGREAYTARTFHNLKSTDEEDRKEWYENMWLNRIYIELDKWNVHKAQHKTEARLAKYKFLWNVPIEIDATASLLQVEGTLLNHKPYLDATNIIGAQIKDAWYHPSAPDVPRKYYKTVATPRMYASSESVQNLWKSKNLIYTPEMVMQMNAELSGGFLGLADAFKNFIVQNVEPKDTMNPVIWGETFEVKCNHFKAIGEYAQPYIAWDTKSNSPQTIRHMHTRKIPDLERFRLYFVTLLV